MHHDVESDGRACGCRVTRPAVSGPESGLARCTTLLLLLQAGSFDRLDQLALEEKEEEQRWERHDGRPGHDVVPGGRVLLVKADNRDLHNPQTLVSRDRQGPAKCIPVG